MKTDFCDVFTNIFSYSYLSIVVFDESEVRTHQKYRVGAIFMKKTENMGVFLETNGHLLDRIFYVMSDFITFTICGGTYSSL